LVAPRPWPVAIFAQRRIIDLDDDDLAARIVRVQVIASNAKVVLGDLAEPDQAEDESGQRRPQQQLSWFLFQSLIAALRHGRGIPFPRCRTCARAKVSKTLTAS